MTTLIQDAALLAAPAAGIVATGATGAALHYRRRAAQRLGFLRSAQERARDAEQRAAAMDEEAVHLAHSRLPALLAALGQEAGAGHRDGGVLHSRLAGSRGATAFQTVLDQVSGWAREEAERAEGASRAAVQAVVRSLQSLIYEQQVAITVLLESQHEEKVLELANPIDHAGSQLARRAQVVGVLTGMWPGRQREDAPLVDAVRGGVSRIRDYRRVRITGEPTQYVLGRFVEPVVLAAAELLDNATRYSEPGTMVEVWYVDAHHGISIVIEDAGIGLTPENRERAARLLSGQVPVRITELRTPPQFGFLAVGALAARYGFCASVEQQSAHGGVRAVLHLPRALLSGVPSQAPAAAGYQVPAGGPADGAAGDGPAAGGPYPVAADGLPVRRRGQGPRFTPSAPAAAPAPGGAGRSVAAFVRGTHFARTPSSDQEPTT
ncbi:hypothetical protein GCM10010371_63700 [Streptomyces subrutilus]|uniref:histidine kinase n=1 Tax=Streptomyces subrutilus TaxID=36818 RepID=A0A918RHB2_9ACTN|nr:sensor histidine kinase [Streptomyces subrutilus]GGZ95068.1 hypothetical protein GCM10010371_63700 [Streptomyces subrutilus]